MQIEPRLIKDCIKGDRRAQSELYRRCYGVLMGVCMRYHRQEEDAVSAMNMAFLKILNNLKKRKDNVPFEAWIRRITINVIIDEFRKNKKHKEAIEYRDFDDRDNSSVMIDLNKADQQFDAEDIERIIQELPQMSREVFNMYAIDGYSHKEISSMLSISVGTSKWHVSFARTRIKERIELTKKIHHRSN
ncbi:MAG: RNA polymerase sigma factor [Bacteroidia bacterium]|nr:RNA polymerase sigma factor [Bacteroidia bacterium]